MTRYPRQIDREYLSCRSGGLNKVQMIDGGTSDLDQDLVVCNRRRRYIVEHKRPTVFHPSDSFHTSSPFSTQSNLMSRGRPLCALQKRFPILRLRPRLEVVEGDLGKFMVERGAIHRKSDAVEPFVHPGGILAHALADDIERDLVIGEGPAGDARENGDDVIPRKQVAREVEALAREATGVLEDTNGDRPDVRDGNLRERPCRRERRRIDPFSELLLREIEVLHKGNGRENRCADADFGDVLFNLVLAVEVRNARPSVGGADGRGDESDAGGLGR